MNTQYRKNLKDVATACKNYTDTKIAQAKEEIYWHIGEYSVTTSDDNTSASVKTVPANATRCKIKRVYGNTQKLNPTTASDSTSAMMKTMPSTVYDFDVSKVEGNSEVSENLYNPATNTTGKAINSSGAIIDNNNSYYSDYIAVNSSTAYYLTITNLASNSDFRVHYYDSSKTWLSTSLSANSTFTTPNNCSYVRLSVYNEADRVSNIMLNRGSTALPYQPYFDGIHNFAWTGVKVEGANLFDKDNYTYQNAYYDVSGTLQTANNTSMNLTPISVLPNAQYSFKVNTQITYFGVCFFNETTFISRSQSKNTDTLSFTTPANCNYIYIYVNPATGNINANYISTIEPMLNYGSTSLDYEPYVSQTLPIDLSTILYNGSPLFEGNALKGVGTAKDYITPYKACKVMGSRAYQSGDEEDTSVLTDGTTTLYPLATPIEVSINWDSTLRGITGYSNGTITLLNTYNMDSANTITYNSIIKENCCAKMVQSRNGSVIKTINFPTQASDGYSAGSVSNVRDFTNNTRTPYVDKVDLGSLNWSKDGDNRFYNRYGNDLKVINNGGIVANISCVNYKTVNFNAIDGRTEEGIASIISANIASIFIYDTGYNNTTTFKTAMNGIQLYYEKETSTSSSITAIENVIVVQAGDELAFYDSNDNLVTVPTDLTYRIEVER